MKALIARLALRIGTALLQYYHRATEAERQAREAEDELHRMKLDLVSANGKIRDLEVSCYELRQENDHQKQVIQQDKMIIDDLRNQVAALKPH